MMMQVDKKKLREISQQFPWNSREEYRLLRKIRPDLGLPSDKELSREWGSFSSFQEDIVDSDNKEHNLLSSLKGEGVAKKLHDLDDYDKKAMDISQENHPEEEVSSQEIHLNTGSFDSIDHHEDQKSDEENLQDTSELTEKQIMVFAVRSVCGKDFTRKDYRKIQKENPELPSTGVIRRMFGSFGAFKNLVKGLSEEINPPTETEHQEETEEEQAIRLARVIWSNGEEFTRNDYRKRRNAEANVNLPSTDKIQKMFGSFGKFKEAVIRGFIDSSDIFRGEWNPTPKELEQVKSMVKAKRRSMFGDQRKPYEWELEGRKRRAAWAGII